MKNEKIIGRLLILGAIGVFIPYTLLTITFEYPDVLRQDAGVVLTKFDAGGDSLVWTWWAFAMLGFPLLIAYLLIGQQLSSKLSMVKWVTTLGVISGVVQIVGLLRWVFVVPVIADTYVQATDAATQAAAKMAFQAVHQFGGVLLGEHLGQLLTIAWTVGLSYAFWKLRMMPRWVTWLGGIAAGIYLLAQAELFATVMPGFPVWDLAGLIGSSLWLIWLIVVGVMYLRRSPLQTRA
jgi:hypothetical protein